MFANVPEILKDVGKYWPIKEQYTDRNGILLIDSFLETYGSSYVPVDNISDSDSKRACMLFREFVARVLAGECLYCKDWHFVKSGELSGKMYHVPSLFEDDWLNWYLLCDSSTKDDFCFLYVGSANSTTFVHHDVLCSYSWSVNISGKKKWSFWSPKNSENLFSNDSELFNRRTVLDSRPGKYCPTTFPNLIYSKPTMVIEQAPGEAVFVPAGWYHMVENICGSSTSSGSCQESNVCMQNCIELPPRPMHSTRLCPESTCSEQFVMSLNHNWTNGFAIYETWRFLLDELNGVRYELRHLYPSPPLPPASTSTKPSCSAALAQCPPASSLPSAPSKRRNHLDSSVDILDRFSASSAPANFPDEVSWLQQCEIMLRANASMDLREFLGMISGRMRVFLIDRLSHQDDDRSLPTAGDLNVEVTITGEECNPRWANAMWHEGAHACGGLADVDCDMDWVKALCAFCINYQLTPSDIRVCKALRLRQIPGLESLDSDNFPSSMTEARYEHWLPKMEPEDVKRVIRCAPLLPGECYHRLLCRLGRIGGSGVDESEDQCRGPIHLPSFAAVGHLGAAVRGDALASNRSAPATALSGLCSNTLCVDDSDLGEVSEGTTAALPARPCTAACSPFPLPPLTGMQYSALQVYRVVEEILSSPEVLDHLAAAITIVSASGEQKHGPTTSRPGCTLDPVVDSKVIDDSARGATGGKDRGRAELRCLLREFQAAIAVLILA